MKDGRDLFHRFLKSRYKAPILRAVQSGESSEFNRFHKVKKRKNTVFFLAVTQYASLVIKMSKDLNFSSKNLIGHF